MPTTNRITNKVVDLAMGYEKMNKGRSSRPDVQHAWLLGDLAETKGADTCTYLLH